MFIFSIFFIVQISFSLQICKENEIQCKEKCFPKQKYGQCCYDKLFDYNENKCCDYKNICSKEKLCCGSYCCDDGFECNDSFCTVNPNYNLFFIIFPIIYCILGISLYVISLFRTYRKDYKPNTKVDNENNTALNQNELYCVKLETKEEIFQSYYEKLRNSICCDINSLKAEEKTRSNLKKSSKDI